MSVTTGATLDDLLPTDDEVAEYRRRGWYVTRPIFTDDELDAAIEGSERFYGGELRYGDNPKIPPWARPTPGEYDGLRKHDYADFATPELRALVVKPVLGAIAARLAGADGIRLWHTQLLLKAGEGSTGPGNVGWHTDEHYWWSSSSTEMLTAWVPFDDVDDEIGTITMLDGSRHWPDNSAALNFFEQDMATQEDAFDTGGAEVVKVPLGMRRGQVSFHHMRTVHGSGPNRTRRDRRSMAVHLQPADNRWRWHARRIGDGAGLDAWRVALHANDFIVPRNGDHGVPDYTEPRWFPTLYPAASPSR